MQLLTLRFWCPFFTILAMTTGFAHLFELPNKMKLPAKEYLTVQQIYRGWDLLGIVIALAILSNLALAISLRHKRPDLWYSVVALLAMIGTQVVFWTVTFPINTATSNWTVLPGNWELLRLRWEYSHAVSAGLELVAVVALLLWTGRK